MIDLIKRYPLRLDAICWIFFMLNWLDCIFTTIMLDWGFVEQNPLWGSFSVWYKLPVAVVVILLFSWNRNIMYLLTMAMAFLVGWQIFNIIYFAGRWL